MSQEDTDVCDSEEMHLPERNRPLGFTACAAAGALWGTGFLFGKIALREMSVGHMVLYRFLFALIPLFPIAVRRTTPWSRRDWAILLVSAFFGIPLQFLIQFQGLKITSLAHASLMIGTMPVVLAVGAALFLRERLHAAGWAALAASTAGACLIALSSGGAAGRASLRGDALVVLSMVIALVWIMGSKSLLNRHGALLVSARSVAVGTLMLAVWVCLQYGPPPVHHVSPAAWASLAASGLLCTAATTCLWNWAMTQVPASQAGIFLNMEPLIGSALGMWLFGDRLGPAAWLGGILIVGAAVYLTTHNTQPEPVAALVHAE